MEQEIDPYLEEGPQYTEEYLRLEKIWRALRHAYNSGYHRNDVVKQAMDNISADMACEIGG